jgi:thymidylate synthase ThyX
MIITPLAISTEEYGDGISEKMATFSGKMAGICYMKDTYFNSSVSDNVKAYNRFKKVANTGHHSIADHSHITLLFENIPKMTAMILNSLGSYTTSEKSGRYTIMEDSGRNKELYDKWYEIFFKLILSVYPDFDNQLDGTVDENLRKKLAQENARYMLSVFAPATTMSYTVSLRQLSYIVQWCKDWVEKRKNLTCRIFDMHIYNCINELYTNLIKLNLHNDCIQDNKGRTFNFLAKQTHYNIWQAEESFSESYLIKYKVSFACLAQEQRHRTIDYFMVYDGAGKQSYYVPEILKHCENSEELIKEWINDLESLVDTFPIATKVGVVEVGSISNFMLKCDERLCGRVQLETMNNCLTNLYRFERTIHKSDFMRQQLERHFNEHGPIMKCGNIACKEPCRWGGKNAITRYI